MGVVNVTPDSFSDGGAFLQREAAVAHGLKLAADGALIIDVGGESTRPGAIPVTAETEIDRVRPVIRDLAAQGVIVSIDTLKPEVAEAALDAGASIVNDISGLRDSGMLQLCARRAVPVVLMHMQGEPQTMQLEPTYADVVTEVAAYLLQQATAAQAAGVPAVIIDPGIGFGKTPAQNLLLLQHLDRFTQLGWPVLVGASRKSLIGALLGSIPPAERDAASLAIHLFAGQQGVALVRAHDVAAHVQALRAWSVLQGSR
jgi:dihydropteroate synthase